MLGVGFFLNRAGEYTSTGMGEFIFDTSFIVPEITTTSFKALTSGFSNTV
jgi:hypothetical protein